MQGVDRHVFVDMFHELSSFTGIDRPLQVLSTMPNAIAASIISKGVLQADHFCAAHGQRCRHPETDLEFTGTPCQDYSRAGSRRGLFHGSRFPIIWAWIRIMLLKEPPIIVHENVLGFPEDILVQLFQHIYHIFILHADAKDQGFDCVSRPRVYIMMFHTGKTVLLRSPVEIYAVLKLAIDITGNRLSNISSCFQASAAELISEFAPRTSRLGLCSSDILSVPAWHLLSIGEKQRLDAYIQLYIRQFRVHPSADPNCIFTLSDNPLERCVWSAGSGRLPCFRTNGGKQWSCYLGRWLTSRELLACMGVPVYPHLASMAGVPVVHVESGPAAAKMVGNMYHIATAGSVMLACLVSVRLKDLSS